jgi:uncharacterized damage-inducible protein DinB
MIKRPESSEFATNLTGYIQRVPEGDLPTLLNDQLEGTLLLVRDLSEEEASFRYAPEKWSIKQLLGHLADAERIMSYRLLRIARGDNTPLPGFEEDDYVKEAAFDSFTLEDLLANLSIIRTATLSLLKGLTPAAYLCLGTVNGNIISARALAYLIAGHELHHRSVLKDRYLL